MWDLIVSAPDHCLSFYFSMIHEKHQLSLMKQEATVPGFYYS